MTDTKPEPRTCANCACSIIRKHPVTLNETQMFCQRHTVVSAMARLERPRLDRNKNIVAGRDGKPIMERVEELIFMHAPTVAEATCFDGWRPQGTLPGDFSYKSADLDAKVFAMMQRLSADALEDMKQPKAPPGTPACSHGVLLTEYCLACEQQDATLSTRQVDPKTN